MTYFQNLRRVGFNACRKLTACLAKITIEFPANGTIQIDPKRPVCYIVSEPSAIDTHLLATACERAGLPSLYQQDVDGRIGRRVYALQQPESLFGARQLPAPAPWMSALIAELAETDVEDIQLVPVTVCVGRAPEKEQSSFKLLFSFTHGPVGRLKKTLSLLIHGRNSLVHFNAPVSLQRVVQEKQEQQLVLRKLSRLFRVHFRKQREQIVGPDLSHRRTLIKSIISTPTVEAAIQREAKNNKLSYEKARKKAYDYGQEIASDYSFAAVRFLERIMNWFWTRFFRSIEISGIERVKELSYQSTVVYAPCHRSHLDYLLLSYILYQNGLSLPQVAGGINLNMPVIGPLLRRGGAFFIRRSFSGNALYGAVFTEYMHSLLQKGFPVEYFIEGGRSRTGRSLHPKAGLLAMTISSYLRQQNKSIKIVPVYVGYERILEGNSYLGELRGKAKRKESPWMLAKAITKLKMNFGHVYVNFGEAIDLGEFVAEHSPEKLEPVTAGSRLPWVNNCAKDLGEMIITRINDAIAVNPINLLAIALLSTPRLAMSREELLRQLAACKTYLAAEHYSDQMTLTDKTPEQIIEHALSLDFIHQETDSLGDILYLEGSQAVLMTYYRNNVLHLFTVVGIISGLLLHHQPSTEAEIIALVTAIYPYLEDELYCSWVESDLAGAVTDALQTLQQIDAIEQVDGRYRCAKPTTAGYRVLATLAQTMQQNLERYYIVISMVLQSQDQGASSAKVQELCRKIAERLGFLYGLNAPEFFDKTLFSGFMRQLESKKLISTTDGHVSFQDGLVELYGKLEQALPREIKFTYASAKSVISNSN